jgi:hypothetical protein
MAAIHVIDDSCIVYKQGLSLTILRHFNVSSDKDAAHRMQYWQEFFFIIILHQNINILFSNDFVLETNILLRVIYFRIINNK